VHADSDDVFEPHDASIIDVSMEVQLLQLIDVDVKRGTASIALGTVTWWMDRRMARNTSPSRADGIQVWPARFKAMRMYVPDVSLLEAIDSQTATDNANAVQIHNVRKRVGSLPA
jgi:hypothetical protein